MYAGDDGVNDCLQDRGARQKSSNYLTPAGAALEALSVMPSSAAQVIF
jgi:hypothetical protein